MPTLITLSRTITSVAALGLVACDAQTAVEPAAYDDVAQILASSLGSDTGGGLPGALADVMSLAHGTRPPGFVTDRHGWFVGTHGDATYKYQLTCADVAGRLLPACGDATDHAMVIAAWYGVTDQVAYHHRFNRAVVWQLDHLQAPMGTITGVSQLTAEATFGVIGTPVAYALTAGFDERYLLDTAARTVLLGDLSAEMVVRHDGERLDITALVAIDEGATSAAIQLDGELVTEIELDTSFPGE